MLLFSILLFLQGVPVQPTQGGTITGVLRAADGKPAAGVRVAAVPQTESLEQSTGGATLSSIAETDGEGRYKLESVPPGRYYIAAGRLDLPTYYPGTQSMAVGRTVALSAGLTVTGIDFVMNANSAGRAEAGTGQSGITLLDLTVDVRVEGGGKLPLLSGGKPITIQLTPTVGTSTPVSIPISANRFSLAPPIVDYRVVIQNLPDGYTVKSVKYGGAELQDRILSLTSVTMPNGNVLWASAAAYTASAAAYTAALLSRLTGNTPPPSPQQTLAIVLDSAGVLRILRNGIRVSGSLPPGTIRSLNLGDVPGTVFSDGTFEFRNVPPGRHILMTTDNTPASVALVASVVAGTNDLIDVEVVRTSALPLNIRALSRSTPAGTQSPGVLQLPALHGRVLDAETGMAVTAGRVFLVGDSWKEFELKDGSFEFPGLLPGSYEVEVQGAGYPTLRRPVVIQEQDMELVLKAG